MPFRTSTRWSLGVLALLLHVGRRGEALAPLANPLVHQLRRIQPNVQAQDSRVSRPIGRVRSAASHPRLPFTLLGDAHRIAPAKLIEAARRIHKMAVCAVQHKLKL